MRGGNSGLWALRMPFEHLGTRLFPDMFSLAQAHEAFAADGSLADEKLQHFFESTVDCFVESVEAALARKGRRRADDAGIAGRPYETNHVDLEAA